MDCKLRAKNCGGCPLLGLDYAEPIAHTLGNPFDLKVVRSFCDKHNLWLVEDNCDALGSEYCWEGTWKKTGLHKFR